MHDAASTLGRASLSGVPQPLRLVLRWGLFAMNHPRSIVKTWLCPQAFACNTWKASSHTPILLCTQACHGSEQLQTQYSLERQRRARRTLSELLLERVGQGHKSLKNPPVVPWAPQPQSLEPEPEAVKP